MLSATFHRLWGLPWPVVEPVLWSGVQPAVIRLPAFPLTTCAGLDVH